MYSSVSLYSWFVLRALQVRQKCRYEWRTRMTTHRTSLRESIHTTATPNVTCPDTSCFICSLLRYDSSIYSLVASSQMHGEEVYQNDEVLERTMSVCVYCVGQWENLFGQSARERRPVSRGDHCDSQRPGRGQPPQLLITDVTSRGDSLVWRQWWGNPRGCPSPHLRTQSAVLITVTANDLDEDSHLTYSITDTSHNRLKGIPHCDVTDGVSPGSPHLLHHWRQRGSGVRGSSRRRWNQSTSATWLRDRTKGTSVCLSVKCLFVFHRTGAYNVTVSQKMKNDPLYDSP